MKRSGSLYRLVAVLGDHEVSGAVIRERRRYRCRTDFALVYVHRCAGRVRANRQPATHAAPRAELRSQYEPDQGPADPSSCIHALGLPHSPNALPAIQNKRIRIPDAAAQILKEAELYGRSVLRTSSKKGFHRCFLCVRITFVGEKSF